MNDFPSYFRSVALGLTVLVSTGCQTGNRNQPNWIARPGLSGKRTFRPLASNEAVASPTSAKNTKLNGYVSSSPTILRKTSLIQSSALRSPAASVARNKPTPATASKTLQTVGYLQSNNDTHSIVQLPYEENANGNEILSTSSVVNTAPSGMPIDFPSVLRLAGADNWNVKIAQERIGEAVANHRAAKVAWLPTLNYGIGYNHHEGEIQATEGDVQTVSRGSFFVGGGSRIGNLPLAGGSGGPGRMAIGVSLADSIFQPLVTCQLVRAEQYRESRVFNDVLLSASLAYFELVRAQSQLAISVENQRESEQVLKLTTDFVAAGKGTLADQQRLKVIVNERRRDVATARAQIGIASAQLATVLQLDPTKLDPSQGLFALEDEVVPIDMVGVQTDLSTLVNQALATRQEIKEAETRAGSASTQLAAEQWRPYLPNLNAGMSNGFFGGGQGSNLPKLDGRSDIDLQMTWEVRNLGMGNRALRDARRSQLNQTIYGSRQIKDQIAGEVTTAFHQVQLQADSMSLLQENIRQSESALHLNVEAIKSLEGMPLESVQSLNALATARTDYQNAVIDYNRAQLQLLRAIGQPITQ